MVPVEVQRGVRLAGHTTLGVGGPAWAYAETADPARAAALAEWAAGAGRPVLVLGGGSNLLVADKGFHGLALRFRGSEVTFGPEGAVRVEAGLAWDSLVAAAVDRGLAGLEALSGIPGDAGAAPIQNIGAYGQEVAEVLEAVEALELATGAPVVLGKEACGFGYRHSAFKGEARGRYLVTALRLRLDPGAAPRLRYPELSQAVGPAPSLAEVRAAVLRIRASKSMVLDPADPNRRSAGSFFMNPVVSADLATEVADRAAALGLGAPPRYPAADAQVKLSAAWLIERAGFGRGYGEGPAGLSTRHCLALVNRGGATAHDLLTLAREVRAGVQRAFGVTLRPEPVFVGFEADVDALLSDS
jgi:UDP-N-acetylmuramate dehydrogenase